MKKLDALRALMVEVVPGLKDNPENLSVFASKGRLGAAAGDTLSFEYRYAATLVLQDFAGDQDHLFVNLLAWVAREQPELLRRREGEPFAFEVDLIDDKRCDIEVEINVSERVIVRQGDGGWHVEHLLDTPIDNSFDGLAVPLSELILHDITAGRLTFLPSGEVVDV